MGDEEATETIAAKEPPGKGPVEQSASNRSSTHFSLAERIARQSGDKPSLSIISMASKKSWALDNNWR